MLSCGAWIGFTRKMQSDTYILAPVGIREPQRPRISTCADFAVSSRPLWVRADFEAIYGSRANTSAIVNLSLNADASDGTESNSSRAARLYEAIGKIGSRDALRRDPEFKHFPFPLAVLNGSDRAVTVSSEKTA